MKSLSVFALLSLFILPTSFAAASPSRKLVCRDNQVPFLSATLVNSPQWGWIANLIYNYNETLPENSSNNGLRWMSCDEQDNAFHCKGQWSVTHRRVEAVFANDPQGHLSVIFTGPDSVAGSPQITLECVAK